LPKVAHRVTKVDSFTILVHYLQCHDSMPAITSLLRKFGYIKIADYGLLLNDEHRVVTLQENSLIDAGGGRIVGWKANDLAPMALSVWPATKSVSPAAGPALATVVATQPARVVLPQAAQILTIAMEPVAIRAAGVAEEDEWEWEIALARARVAREDIVARRAQLASPVAGATSRRRRSNTVPPPAETNHRDIAAVEAPAVGVAATTTAPIRSEPPKPPKTMIPIPSIRRAPTAPVVRTQGAASDVNWQTVAIPAPPRRFPKGTGPVDPVAIRAKLAQPLPLPTAAKVIELNPLPPR
jgi:hypothetical protein